LVGATVAAIIAVGLGLFGGTLINAAHQAVERQPMSRDVISLPMPSAAVRTGADPSSK
jgi:hypothetical protein